MTVKLPGIETAPLESIAQYEAVDGTQLQVIPAYTALDFHTGLSLSLTTDCNGTLGGSSSIDYCGSCYGGLTECSAEQNTHSGNAQNCVEACPKSIPLTESIAEIGRQVSGKLWQNIFKA